MTKGRTVAWLLGVALVAGTVVVAQQSSKTTTAEFGAEEVAWDWTTNVFELVGGCWLNIKADHDARMTARAMTVKADKNLQQVEMLTAAGPVKFEVLTAKDKDGLQRKIVASCSQKATYEEKTQVVELIGNAEADVTTLPEGNVEAAHLTGDKVTVDLKANKVTVTKAHVTVTTEIETEKGEQ